MKEEFFEHQDCRLHNLYSPTEAAVDVFYECEAQTQYSSVPNGAPDLEHAAVRAGRRIAENAGGGDGKSST